MELKDAIKAALQELIISEIRELQDNMMQLKGSFDHINKKLDDMHMNIHQADPKRRLYDTNRQIEMLRSEFNHKYDAVNKRFEVVNSRFDIVNDRFDALNKRIDDLQAAMVRREEHSDIIERIHRLELDMSEIYRKVAA